MHAAALELDLHLPHPRSLKAKRAVVKPVIEGCRRRFGVSVAEVDHQDQWQRAGIAIAAVASSHRQLEEVLDAVERFVWSFPELEVVSCERTWI
ncbi:MAG: DUF503 domain-containing protein [Acidimicrobiales bacterium]